MYYDIYICVYVYLNFKRGVEILFFFVDESIGLYKI